MLGSGYYEDVAVNRGSLRQAQGRLFASLRITTLDGAPARMAKSEWRMANSRSFARGGGLRMTNELGSHGAAEDVGGECSSSNRRSCRWDVVSQLPPVLKDKHDPVDAVE